MIKVLPVDLASVEDGVSLAIIGSRPLTLAAAVAFGVVAELIHRAKVLC